MEANELRATLISALEEHKELGPSELRRILNSALYSFEEAETDWSVENKGESWTDDELRLILSDAPTRANCLKYARVFKRGLGSIEQIYRWAGTSLKDVGKKRPEDKFVKQIKSVAKEVGWVI